MTPSIKETVERLRNFWPNGFDAGDVAGMCEESAALIERLAGALSVLLELNDSHGPFGGEIYQDRIDRAWDGARRALSGEPTP